MTAPDQYDAEAEKALPCDCAEWVRRVVTNQSRTGHSHHTTEWMREIGSDGFGYGHFNNCPSLLRPAIAKLLRETAQREREQVLGPRKMDTRERVLITHEGEVVSLYEGHIHSLSHQPWEEGTTRIVIVITEDNRP